MLQVDLESLKAKHPEYDREWRSLHEWLVQHADRPFIRGDRLAVELPDVGTVVLARMIYFMQKEGRWELVYRVQDPSTGTFVGSEFARPSDIPTEVEGRFGTFVRTEDNIVSVLREPSR